MKEKPTSPYRQPDRPPQSIEEMEKEIAAAGKIGIRLPNKLEPDQEIDLAKLALDLKVKLEKTLLYSTQWGILRFHKRKETEDPTGRPFNFKDDLFIFQNDQGRKVAFLYNSADKKFVFLNDRPGSRFLK